MFSKRKKISYSRKTRRGNRICGGKAIAAGTYGCVFKGPALQCDREFDATIPKTPRSYVSKLMLEKHMLSEMELINKVKQYIKSIPHKERYFLVADAFSCRVPAPIKVNADNFNGVCKRLVENGLNAENINKHLDTMGLINMPDGGIELDDTFKAIFLNSNSKKNTTFPIINQNLVELLLKAVAPMNKRGVLHNDLKGNNILVSENLPRIIDWGLSCFFKATGTLPTTLFDRSLNFNRPLASVLFTKQHKNIIKLPVDFTQDDVINAAVSLLRAILAERQGHYRRLKTRLLPSVYAFVNAEKDYRESDKIIIRNVASVLHKFTAKSTGEFDTIKYFRQVYRHNADVIGFLMCYQNLFSLQKSNKAFTEELATIFKTYCFDITYTCKPIPLAALAADLLKLNNLL